MMISVVDLRYMLEDHCLSACPSPVRSARWGQPVMISSIFGTHDGEYQSTALIYHFLILV